MIISFPILISETVDKEMLPYLVKAIERNFALTYIPALENAIREQMNKKHISDPYTLFNTRDGSSKLILNLDENAPLLEAEEAYGIQVIPGESNKLMNDQPYFITLRITTSTKITHDVLVGFKGSTVVSRDALSIFEDNLDESRYWLYREARKMLSEDTVWKMQEYYRKIFNPDQSSDEKRKHFTKKVLFSEHTERVAVLSANDLSKESFEYSKSDDVALSAGNLKKSQFSALYLDDSLNKKIYMWDQNSVSFASIITYDMLFKNNLNALTEEVGQAKQKDTSLFSKRIGIEMFKSKIAEFSKRPKGRR